MEGIQDPTLNSGLANVYGDPSKLNSFQSCQQYLSTLITSTKIHTKVSQGRQVAVARSKGRGVGYKGVSGRDYSFKEWKLLSAEEKEKVRRIRDEKKRVSDRDGKVRQINSIAGSNDEAISIEGSQEIKRKPGNAGNEFGRSVYNKKKAKSSNRE